MQGPVGVRMGQDGLGYKFNHNHLVSQGTTQHTIPGPASAALPQRDYRGPDVQRTHARYCVCISSVQLSAAPIAG